MRLGRFCVNGEYYRDIKMMTFIQRNIAILNVRIDDQRFDRYEFLAAGEMFDELPNEYGLTPEYEIIMSKCNTTGKLSVTYKRIK